jgi:hypothetical protein
MRLRLSSPLSAAMVRSLRRVLSPGPPSPSQRITSWRKPFRLDHQQSPGSKAIQEGRPHIIEVRARRPILMEVSNCLSHRCHMPKKDPEVVKYVMLNFSGSEGDDVRINFTLRISPDTSSDLSKYVDLTLNGWDIEVDFPDSLWISPLGLSWMLFYGVAAEQEPVNEGILTFIARVLAGEDSSITQAAAQLFLQTQVTVTFMNIAYPENAYSWGLADTNDQTVILRATPAIGFPILF